MRVVVADAPGRVRVTERDDARPGPGQVLVALEAAPVHHGDLALVDGTSSLPRLPGAPLGDEGVGRVVARGPGVDLPEGARVLLPFACGTWSDHRVVAARGLVSVADDVPLDVAATAVVAPATAWSLLGAAGPLRPGEWIVQVAAAGAVGRWVAALARDAGVHTLNVVRDDRDTAAVHAAGGDVVVVDGPDLPAAVADYTSGAHVRLALDGVGGPGTDRLARCLGHGGTVVVYGDLAGAPCQVTPERLIARDLTVRGFWLGAALQQLDRDDRAARLATLLARAARSGPAPRVAATIPLERAPDAVDAARRARGRVLLTGPAFTA